MGLKKFAGAIVLVTHDRWFSRIVVEGASPRALLLEEEDADDGEDESSSDDEESSVRPGQTFRVGGGNIKKMEKGMLQYVGIVERRLERRRKAAT